MKDNSSDLVEIRVYQGETQLYSFLIRRDSSLDAKGLMEAEDIYEAMEGIKLYGGQSIKAVHWKNIGEDGEVFPSLTTCYS